MNDRPGYIGRYGGVDFYTSLNAILKDGKTLYKSGENLGCEPQLCVVEFEDVTGVVSNLKNKIKEAYIESLEEIANRDVTIDSGKPVDFSIITVPLNELKEKIFLTTIFMYGDIDYSFLKKIKEGYTLAEGVLSVPYTFQAIEGVSRGEYLDEAKNILNGR